MSKATRTSPRKFAEKIALLNKKESESNAAFEKIIKEAKATTAQIAPLLINSNLIPTINQLAAQRQRRRSSTNLKRSLSLRASSRERSLSSVCVNAPPVGHFLVASNCPGAQKVRRASYTTITSQPTNDNYHNNYVHTYYNDDPYHESHGSYATATTMATNHQPARRRSQFVDDLDQPYSLPVDVPNIKIFSIDDDHGNHFVDDDEWIGDGSNQSYHQQVTEPSGYLEPFQSATVYGHSMQQQQHHQPMNNRLSQPYAVCNSHSLPDMSNLGFGSSDEISVYGSPYGDEPSPLMAQQTNNHVNYYVPVTGQQYQRQEQYQQQEQHHRPDGRLQSSYQAPVQLQSAPLQPPQTGPVMVCASQPVDIAIPEIQIYKDIASSKPTQLSSSPAVHHAETSRSFQENILYQTPKDDITWSQTVNLPPRLVESRLSPEQQQPVSTIHHQAPLTKSVSGNAIYETACNWNDTSNSIGGGCSSSYVTEDPYTGVQPANSENSGGKLNSRLSRSYNDGLYAAGQSALDPFWTS